MYPKYKIVLKTRTFSIYQWYFVYRKHLFWWKKIAVIGNQKEAEKFIENDKRRIENRKQKSKLIGYY